MAAHHQVADPAGGSRAAAGPSRPALTPNGRSTEADARATSAVVVEMRVANTGGAGARLRSAPSREADAIAILPDGAVVQALGPERETGDESWQRVRAEDGAEGWVASDLLAPATNG